MKFRETINHLDQLVKVERFSNGTNLGEITSQSRYWPVYENADDALRMPPRVLPAPPEPTSPPTQAEIDRAEALAYLAATDGEMNRISEDVINALDAKNILKKADLPQPAQDKLAMRAAKRALL
jgi:hypothetical protein